VGGRLVEPAEEAAQLTAFYTHTIKVRFPISLWQGKKVPTDDGGMAPANAGPNFANYPIYGTPNIYVIDGKGRIRRIYVEGITPAHEAELATLITFLHKEASGSVE